MWQKQIRELRLIPIIINPVFRLYVSMTTGTKKEKKYMFFVE